MNEQLIALTVAVADGQALDWSSVDPSGLDTFDRAQLDELRAVDGIGRCLASLTVSSSLGLQRGRGAGPGVAWIETWGGLAVREHVGRGRFGDVFRAWDPAIERHVALKLLRDAQPPSESAVVHEARLMARVRHPNVATIFGAAHQDGRTGLWMEFVEGQTLQSELRERGPLPADEAAGIGIELCRALAAVHAAGLVHRDVKSQNVMREVGGRVVLGDFGTGLELEVDSGDIQLAGTPLYLAPELWDGSPATSQSDLYSLGVLLFHLATGSFPVDGRSISDIRGAHASGVRKRLADVRGDLPPAFVEAVDRVLAPSPADRFADAREMEAALAASISQAIESVEPSSRDIRGGLAGTQRWMLPLAAGAGVAAVVVVLFALAPMQDWIRLTGRQSKGAVFGEPAAGPRQLRRVPAPSGQFWGQPSPDGRTFSFVDLQGNLGTFDVSSGEQRILTDPKQSGGSAFESSTFSPDGRMLAYGWETTDGNRELRLIDLAGGQSHAIWRSRDEIAHPLDWADRPDRILVAIEKRSGGRTLGVLRRSGSPLTNLTTVESGFSTARLSPDGEFVVFDDLQRSDTTERDIFIADLNRPGQRTRIIAAGSDDFGPLWTRDGDGILFISNRTGEPSVWSVSMRAGSVEGEPTILHRNLGRVAPNGLASDGTLYYRLQVGLVDVYEAGFDPTQEAAVVHPEPLAPSQVGSKANAQWSPDGARLLYVALPHAGTGAPNSRRLAILDRASGATRMLNPPLSYYFIPRWSPDGRTILVKGMDLQSRNGLFLIDAATGATRVAALVDERTPEQIGPFQWGTDSATVLFTRQRGGLVALDLASGKERVVFDFASDGITGFTPMPGFGLSRKGRMLAYSAYRQNALGANETVLRVKGPGEPARDLVVGPVRMEDWTPDGHILFTKSEKGQTMALWSVLAAGGPPVPLGFQANGLRNVSIDPDGRRLVFTAGFPGSEVWALSNFLPQPPTTR